MLRPLYATLPLALRDNAEWTWRAFRKTKAYDLMVAMPLLLWYGASVGQVIPSLAAKLLTLDPTAMDFAFIVSVLVEMASVAIIVLALICLLMRGPARAKAKGATPRIAALGGSYLGVAIVWLPPAAIGIPLSLVSLVLMLGGIGFSFLSLMHLGRSFSLMAEARALVTDGPYRLIRHPLYLGELLTLVGFMLQYISAYAVVVVGLQFAFQTYRMRNEEQVLASQFPEYEGYRSRTYRILPWLY